MFTTKKRWTRLFKDKILFFISNVDHAPDNELSQSVIAAMIKNDVKRVIA